MQQGQDIDRKDHSKSMKNSAERKSERQQMSLHIQPPPVESHRPVAIFGPGSGVCGLNIGWRLYKNVDSLTISPYKHHKVPHKSCRMQSRPHIASQTQ